MCIRDRLYSTEDKVRDEARIWQARCYLALGWVGEADEILNNLPEEGVYKSRSKIYPLAETELALKPVSYTHLDVYKRQVHKGDVYREEDE